MKRWTLLLGFVLAGCDVTNVEDPFNVAISGVTTYTTYSFSNQRYECEYKVALISSGGRAKDFGVFVDGFVTITYTDGTVVTGAMASNDVLDFWHVGRIGFEQVLVAERIAWHPSKRFRVRHDFRIRISSDNQVITKSTDINCL